MTNRPASANYSEAVADDGGLMPVATYLEHVESRVLTNEDGFGYAVKARMVARASRWSDTNDNPVIRPSLGASCIPEDATHILWYNK